MWHTIGAPRLLIIDSYEMRVLVEPVAQTRSTLAISIDYALPRRLPWRLLGQWLAAYYARWCLDNMIDGTKRDLEQGDS